MTHTKNAVTALHKRKIVKGSHNIVADGGEGIETKEAKSTAIGSADGEANPVLSKVVLSNGDRKRMIGKSMIWKRKIPGIVVGNQLNGAGGAGFGLMVGRNNSQRLRFRLAFKIPTTKILIHEKLLSLTKLIFSSVAR